MDRLRHLDGLRGLAALAVAIFSHFNAFTHQTLTRSALTAPGSEFLWPLYDYAWLAVDVFFVISGIVFAHVYARNLPSAPIFGLRRFARLYPLHLATLVAVAILAGAFAHIHDRTPFGEEDTPYRFVLNLLFIQSGVVDEVYSFNGPAWSLSIEAIMYVLFFIATISSRLVVWSFVLCGIGAALLFSGLTWHHWPLLNASVARGLVGFFGGVLIYRSPGLAWLLPLGALCALPFVPHPTIWWSFVCVFSGMLLLRKLPRLRGVLAHPVLGWLGDRSLGVYLVHTPIAICLLLWFDAEPPGNSGWFMAMYTVLVVCVAHIVYELIEQPAQRWILKLDTRKKQVAPPMAVA